MPSVKGKNCRLRVPGTPTSMTAQACTTSDNTTYQISNTAMRVWSPTATITVLVSGVAQSPTLYTLDRLRGRITFTSTAVRTVTVTGTYLPMATAAKTRMFSYTLMNTLLDDTAFQETWITRIAGLFDASGTLGRRWTVDTFFQDALLNADLLVLEFHTDTAVAADLIAWARISKAAIQSAIEGLVEEDVEWQGTPDADERVASVA